MRMEGHGKTSTASSPGRSSVAGASGGTAPAAGVESAASRLRRTAHFANIMVEFENGDREMAVDVPDSFVAHAKTPPKYPPPAPNGMILPRPGAGGGSGRSTASSPPPPLLSSRDHLKIEPDGYLLNTRGGPVPPPSIQSHSPGVTREGSSSSRSFNHHPQPSAEESLRIKKYSQELMRAKLKRERKKRDDEFLRQSLRGSQKLAALKSSGPRRAPSSRGKAATPLPGPEELVQALLRLKASGVVPTRTIEAVEALTRSQDVLLSLTLNQKLQKLKPGDCSPAVTSSSKDLAEDCLDILDGLVEDDLETDLACELSRLLGRKCGLGGLLSVHDQMALRLEQSQARPLPKPHQADEGELLERLSRYSEPTVKVVRIEKSSEPLGATVKNEGEAVVVGRIIRGGAAESSGLLHEGDEILEVNEKPLRGKNVNEVCDILASMKGTLTLLVVPTRLQLGSLSLGESAQVVHVKAHVDYDPEDDPYVPCRELGISFFKGDILHVINRGDPNWWQARREGEDDSQLPGLIPSSSFQQQREAIKHVIAKGAEGSGGKHRKYATGLFCGKKKRRSVIGQPVILEESEEVPPYEEVALYYPRSDRKRPVVLVGPPNVGRHHLRQSLMQDSHRFAAAIPHTSRPKRPDELDGQDYHFISRLQFERDILARRFVEHGEYERSYYGTSLSAIRTVVEAEKVCVLNLHPQSLKILKESDLLPFVVFVAPPSLEKFRRWKLEQSEPADDSVLKEIIERARDMEETFGHYFDMVIVYSDPERAHAELLREIELLEREPQWVPAAWLREKR